MRPILKKDLLKRFGAVKIVVIPIEKAVQPTAYVVVVALSLSPVLVVDLEEVLEAEAALGVAEVPVVEVPSVVGKPIELIHKKIACGKSYMLFLFVLLEFILPC